MIVEPPPPEPTPESADAADRVAPCRWLLGRFVVEPRWLPLQAVVDIDSDTRAFLQEVGLPPVALLDTDAWDPFAMRWLALRHPPLLAPMRSRHELRYRVIGSPWALDLARRAYADANASGMPSLVVTAPKRLSVADKQLILATEILGLAATGLRAPPQIAALYEWWSQHPVDGVLKDRR